MSDRTGAVVVSSEVASRLNTTDVGGKAGNLAALCGIVGDIPSFFVVTTEAFRRAMPVDGLGARIRARLAGLGAAKDDDVPAASRQIQSWICDAPIPTDVQDAVVKLHSRLFGRESPVAVRSSAVDEDSTGQSFAGIHDSFLYVRSADAVLDAIRRVWASAFGERALAYRLTRNLPLDEIRVAVVVQEMIDASRSGVAFTCHPATGNPHQVVISSLFGAGEGLVSGQLPADAYTVEKQSLEFTAEIVEKQERLVHDTHTGSGLREEEVGVPDHFLSSLSDDEVRRVSRLAIELENHFGRPQDIEFCFDDAGRLFLLQSRPVSSVRDYGPAAGNRIVWDNSNIIESYAGVTTPMTFSFIRRAYTIVYHCFAEVMGIPTRVVRANRGTFENMLGLFRGRVYYNLANWYRLIRLFPGFAYNARFLETMMGLKEPLGLEDEAPRPGWFRRWFVELPALLMVVARTTWNFTRIRSIVTRFETNFAENYGQWSKLDFRRMRPHELMGLYHEMEVRLLWDWKAPIINDFYVMVFFGVLKRLCGTWCQDETGALQNDLVCGEGGIESAEPARMLLRLAGLAVERPELRHAIETAPIGTLPDRIRNTTQFADFQAEMDRYLELYGFRCMNELKLEEYSLRDRPAQVYQVIRNYLALDDPAVFDVGRIKTREQGIRQTAQRTAFGALRRRRGLVPRSAIFRRVLACARLGVKNRENMRFARTRIYGLLRELLRAVGEQFACEGVLDDREDIFYLRLEEVWDYVKGTAETTDLKGLAAVRRAEYDTFQKDTEAPADRFDTYGIAYHANSRRNWRKPDAEAAMQDGKLRGTGCCPGTVTAPAIVVHNPREAPSLAKEILVAERTDPGWVPLYPAVSGILIERGSLLSHSAVVAREMGIPTIVGITGLLDTVQTGQILKMDGRAGTVEFVDDV
jgi:phosphohistidine swiveling domain-containing protein